MKTKYIGPGDYEAGQVGFLIEHTNPVKRSETWSLSDLPAQTNQSHEPRLHGWCGSWNDTSTNAHGVWRVVKVLANGRVRIEEVVGAAALVDALTLSVERSNPDAAAQEVSA
jgi:hypothetical protein